MDREQNAEPEEGSSPTAGKADWSLRARADTYRDRRDESKRLSDRLARSSASVTGIAGERGAGKSSLAMRVLSKQKKPKVYTQLIHAPTGYEPREFLASVFQAICENVVERIDKELGQKKGLAARAEAEGRRLLRKMLAWMLACLLPLMAAGGYLAIAYSETLNQIDAEYWESRREYLNEEVARIRTDMEDLSEESPEYSDLQSRLEILNRQSILLDDELRNPFPDGIPVNMMLAMAGIALLAYLASLFGLRSLLRTRRERRLTKDKPLKVGLRHLALENLEHLRFKTSVGNTNEAALSVGSFVSKTTASQSLSARPLSIPGLTAQLRLFLQRIAEVYSERVVLCLDELDKIEDPDDLERLLRGLKGVLGQSETHFLLTVSEDALARFATRRRGGRGMVESAFEDVLFLGIVDVDLAGHIVAEMCGERGNWEEGGRSRAVAILLWAFGGGIPREIKRSARICLEEDVVPTSAKSIDVWDYLFRARMKDMATWALRIGGEDENTYEFLSALDGGRAFGREDGSGDLSGARSWGRRFVSDWMARLADMRPEAQSEDVKALSFARAAIEIVVGASAIAFVLDEDEETVWDDRIQMLSRIFEVTPSNVRRGMELVSEYLQEIGMSEANEVEEGR